MHQLEHPCLHDISAKSPWEIGWLIEQLCSEFVDPNHETARSLCMHLARFQQRWRSLWACFSDHSEGQQSFQAACTDLQRDITGLRGQLMLTSGQDAVDAIEERVLQVSVVTTRAPQVVRQRPAAAVRTSQVGSFDRPVFIVAAPRSGSSLLLETLARAANVYTIGDECHEIVEQFALPPTEFDQTVTRLDAGHATPQVVERLQRGVWGQLRNRKGGSPAPRTSVRMLERKHKNGLRIPFLTAAFPNARFIYLYREPHESLASIMEAWNSKRFVTHPQLPGWNGPAWSLILTPNWHTLHACSLAEIAAAQWSITNQQIMDDLTCLPAEQWCAVSYDQFLASPQATVTQLCHACDLVWNQELGTEALPLSRHTLTRPDRQKWRAHASVIEDVLPDLQPIARRARQLCYAPKGASKSAISKTESVGTPQSTAGQALIAQ